MGKYLLLILLMPVQGFAAVPECPIQKDKQSCLQIVDSNFKNFLEFINENTDEENLIEREKMIEASFDIKKYESLACQKTCLN